jgi:protein O-mannosyl-transferase
MTLQQNVKSRLTRTSSESGIENHVQPSFSQKYPVRESFDLKDWLFIVALIATVFLSYYPAWHGGFIWDDDFFITDPGLRSWRGLYQIWFDIGSTLGYYPMLHSAFWIQYWLWGYSTLGYHLVNISLHATAVVMVAVILRRLAIPGAFLAAAIFALHPVHVESVAWISELKNTLSGVFYLASVMLYLRFDRERRTLPYLWALVLFVLAILSKPVTLTLPAALLVIFWWQRGRLSWNKDVLPLLPFFLVAAAFVIDTIWTQSLLGVEGPDFDIPALERVLIAGKAIWFYLGKLFWPVKLIFIYPRWETSQMSVWQYLFPAAAFALLVILWILRRWSRGLLAGFLFFAGTLFPVLGFFKVYTFIYSYVADHYQYLASLGIITLAAAGISTLLKHLQLWKRPAGYAVCVMLLAMLAALTWHQSQMYTDINKLYSTTIDLNPKCYMAYYNRGTIYISQGQYQKAVDDLSAAIRLKPNLSDPYFNRGNACIKLGRYQTALADFTKVISLSPASFDAYNNRAAIYLKLDQYQQAIEDYTKAITIKPDYGDAYSNRASIYLKLGNKKSGCRDAQTACTFGVCDTLESEKAKGYCL